MPKLPDKEDLMHTERELVEGVRNGMASSFDQLYEIYANRLYHFALSILKSKQDAEEVVQNTFFKIWDKRHTLESNQTFKAFIFKIAYHVIVDILRERLKEKEYQDNILSKATSNFNLEESIEFGDLLDRVGEIVMYLPARKNEIYQLSRVNHLSNAEIAERLNISVKTVENAINFSINFIKKRLGNDSLLILLYAALFL